MEENEIEEQEPGSYSDQCIKNLSCEGLAEFLLDELKETEKQANFYNMKLETLQKTIAKLQS